jgi:transposase
MSIGEKLMPSGKRYFIRPGATDMRKSIGTLAAMVEKDIGLSPFTEDYFLFSNRQKSIVKILYWHMNGFALWTKKLEKDRFPWPERETDIQELTEENIRWLLSGIDARKEHKKLVYSRAG